MAWEPLTQNVLKATIDQTVKGFGLAILPPIEEVFDDSYLPPLEEPQVPPESERAPLE